MNAIPLPRSPQDRPKRSRAPDRTTWNAVRATRVMTELFEIFMGDPGVLPDGWREQAEAAGPEPVRARIIADYIAGMTDRFALEEHRVLTDPEARA